MTYRYTMCYINLFIDYTVSLSIYLYIYIHTPYMIYLNYMILYCGFV